MFENLNNAQKIQLENSLRKPPSRHEKKDMKLFFKKFAKGMNNERHHDYEYNGLEIYVTVYTHKHKQPTIDLTTDYFPHTFSSDPADIGRYCTDLTWANIQGCWSDDRKMYEFVTEHFVNYDDKIGPEFKKFKQENPNWNNPLGLTNIQDKKG